MHRCLGYYDGLLVEVGILQLLGHMYAPASSSFFPRSGRIFSDENYLWAVWIWSSASHECCLADGVPVPQ